MNIQKSLLGLSFMYQRIHLLFLLAFITGMCIGWAAEDADFTQQNSTSHPSDGTTITVRLRRTKKFENMAEIQPGIFQASIDHKLFNNEVIERPGSVTLEAAQSQNLTQPQQKKAPPGPPPIRPVPAYVPRSMINGHLLPNSRRISPAPQVDGNTNQKAKGDINQRSELSAVDGE